MNFGENLYHYRKEKGLSQEELAVLCHVSRQAISKWENSTANPDMGNLKALSKALDVSIDTLLDNEQETENKEPIIKEVHYVYGWHWEYRSSLCLGPIPLIHINLGKGRRPDGRFHIAKGIIAIGNGAIGVISLGVLSIGLLSLGILSAGLLAIGCLAIGGYAIGALAIGYMAVGAMAIGVYAFGALAIGSKLGIGEQAYGMIAIGNRAFGDKTLLLKKLYGSTCLLESDTAKASQLLMEANAPGIFQWLFSLLGRC